MEHKICNTLQGECFKARIQKYHRNQPKNSFVAIKKVDRKLSGTKTVIQGDMTFIVEEDIIKEAVILKHLTVDNSPTGDYIVSSECIQYIQCIVEYLYIFSFVIQ